MRSMATQDSPIQEGFDDADDDARIAGIIEQVRADALIGSGADVEAALRQRVAQARIEVPETEWPALLARLAD